MLLRAPLRGPLPACSSARALVSVLLAGAMLAACRGAAPAVPATGPTPAAAVRPPVTGPGDVPGRGAATGAPSVAPGTPVLRILSTNDIHGAHVPRPDAAGRLRGGAVPLAAAIARARRECAATPPCETLLLDAGDMFTGTPGSDWQYGRPVVAYMNALGYAAGTLGNHEFDYGRDTLAARLAGFSFAILGANVRDSAGALMAGVGADTIVERAGVRVGIVGVAGTHTPGTTKRWVVADLAFLDPAPIVSRHIDALRARGAQLVVVTIHDGGRCRIENVEACGGEVFDFARALTSRPDVIVAGHSHTVHDARVDGIPVVQASSSGRALAVVDLPLAGPDRTPRTAVRDVVDGDTTGVDPAVAAIIARSLEVVGPRLREPVTTLAAPLRRNGEQYALGNLIADAVRAAGNGDIGIWNNGGIRADLSALEVTRGALHEVVPFANQLVRVRMNGRGLRDAIENTLGTRGPRMHVSGIRVMWDSTAADGPRLRDVTWDDGRPLAVDAEFSVIINDFMFGGDPESVMPSMFLAAEFLPTRDIDAVAAYLRAQPAPFRGDPTVRMRAIPTPAVPQP